MSPLPKTPSGHPAAPERIRGRLLSRFGRDEQGVTAIEFGFIGLPFFMLVAATLEVGLMFLTSQVMEEAVVQTSRSLLTGQARTRYPDAAGQTANTAAFKNAICAEAGSLVDCGKLVIDVRSYASFAGAKTGTSAASPISGGALDTSNFKYNTTAANQIVVVRAVLEYDLYFTQWSSALANIGRGKRALVASTAFRSEPYL